MAVDFGPTFARAARWRLRQIGGLDVTVLEVLDCANDSVDIAERPDLLDLARAQKLDVHADRLCDARVIIVLIHSVARSRQTDVRHLAKAGVESGLLL